MNYDCIGADKLLINAKIGFALSLLSVACLYRSELSRAVGLPYLCIFACKPELSSTLLLALGLSYLLVNRSSGK